MPAPEHVTGSGVSGVQKVGSCMASRISANQTGSQSSSASASMACTTEVGHTQQPSTACDCLCHLITTRAAAWACS